MIERQLKEQLPKMQQNGEEAYYYSANLTNPGATREIVQMWTYLDDLQYRPKLTSTQRDFVIITSDEELTTNLTSTWMNSFRGNGKGAREKIQRDYDDAVAAAENDVTLAQPEEPGFVQFHFFCISKDEYCNTSATSCYCRPKGKSG
jgi:hypothetical protein